MKLKGFQRQYLRAKAHHLKPKIVIGKNYISDGVLNAIREVFHSEELIKIKLPDTKEKNKYISIISSSINCAVVWSIGKVLIAYKEFPEKELQKIKLPNK